MTEMEMEVQKAKCLQTLKKRRAENFQKGVPFQMLSDQLPKGHAYYHYPDGHIEIRILMTDQDKLYTKHIRNLTEQEGARLLLDYGLQ